MTKKEINVAVKATIAQFQNRMRRASQTVQSFGRSAMRAAMGAKALGAAVMVGLGGAALTALIRNAMNTADAMAKLSDRLGVATDRLIGYRHAAGLAGIGAEAFDGALERMQRTVAKAADAGGPAAKALRAFGVSVESFAKLRPDAQLALIAEKMRGIQDPATRARIAFELFGRSGQQMNNLLRGGVAALQGGVAETQRFGTALSRVSAAKIEQANDQMTRVKTVFQGFATQIALQLAPLISDAAQRFIDFAAGGEGAGGRVAWAMAQVEKAVAKVADVVKALKAGMLVFKAVAQLAIVTVAEAFAGLYKVGVKSINGLIKAANKIPGINIGLVDDSFTGVNAFTASLRQEVQDTITQVKRLRNTPWYGKHVEDYFARIRAKSEQAAQQVAAAANAGLKTDLLDVDKFDAMAEAAKRLYDETRTPFENFQAELEEINKLFKAGELSSDTYQRAVAAAQEKLRKATESGTTEIEAQAEAMKHLDPGGSATEGVIARQATGSAAVANAASQQNALAREKEREQKRQVELLQDIRTELHAMNRTGFHGRYA